MQSIEEPILISGAGIGGLTAAVALRQKGINVEIFESRQENVKEQGTALNIWTNAMQALDYIGLKEQVKDSGAMIERSEIRSTDGKLLIENQTLDLVKQLGAPSISVRRSELIKALLEALGDTPVHYSSRCEQFKQVNNGVSVTLDNGREITGAALIGADGIRSTLRNHIVGDNGPTYLGQTVWRGISAVDGGLEQGTFHMVWGKGAVVGGCYRVDASHVCWFVGTNAPPGGKDKEGSVLPFLLSLLKNTKGPLIPVVESTPEKEIIRTDLFARECAKQWCKGRIALLGDSAHAMPTVLGQGACQAIEDAIVLSDSVANASSIPIGLNDYEKRRIPRITWVRGQVYKLARFQEFKNPVMCWIRNNVVQFVPPKASRKMWHGLLSFSV